MVGIYFSGTGNTKYCVMNFMEGYGEQLPCVSIEDEHAPELIQQHDFIIFGYPIYYSNMPKIVQDFIHNHASLFSNKRIFLIATMGLFSGDGTGCAARLLQKYDAKIIGGLHLKMPDSICDEKALKRSIEDNQELIRSAEQKINNAIITLKKGETVKEGLGIGAHIAGLFGQRLWFYRKTNRYTNKLKINKEKCIGCAICVHKCPMQNITIINHIAVAKDRCTMCYRCIAHCPNQAITLLGNTVYEQCRIERYIE